jgi:hypothetical protein
VTYDPQSNMSLYSQYATQLALKDKVAVVQGGITSASRETIRPIFHRFQTLYFYNTLYEGGVCDRNEISIGTTPAQTVEKLVPHVMNLWGKKVYTIPGGGSNPTGALGYVNCAFELLNQVNTSGMKIDRLVHGTGSSGTQAGLVTGMCAMNAQIPVLGIGTRAPQPKQEQMVYDLACRTAEKLGCAGVVKREDVMANTDYVGEGYGIPILWLEATNWDLGDLDGYTQTDSPLIPGGSTWHDPTEDNWAFLLAGAQW